MEMKSANSNFRYFIHVICCSFIVHIYIYRWVILRLWSNRLIIHLLGFPAFICSLANSGYKGMFSLVDILQITAVAILLSCVFAVLTF